MKNILYGFGSFLLNFLLTFLTFLLVIAFALGGMVLGAFSEIEKSYAQPVLEKIEAAGYFTCTNNQAEDTDFIVNNCPAEVSEKKLTNAFLAGYPGTEELLLSGSALIETFNQVDLPEFPNLTTIPDFQGLFVIVEKANSLGAFSLFNMVQYAEITLEFMDYFAVHGDELMTFMSSNFVTEMQTMIDTAQFALEAARHGIGYAEVLKGTVYPKKQIEQSALLGLIAGVLLIQVLLFGIRGTFIQIRKRNRADQANTNYLETEMD